MPPSYFKGQVVSPTERLDVNAIQTLPNAHTNEKGIVTEETISSEVQNVVSEPTSEIVNPESHETQNTVIREKDTLTSTVIERSVVETPPISEELKKTESRPIIDVKRPERKISGLSLKSIQEKQKMQRELQSQQPDSQNLPTDPFKEETLIEAWKEYTAQVQN